MTEKVGRKTGKKTQAGRDVYETPEKDGTPHGSEMVSEKSTTFKYKDKWINIPSIHDGYRYSEDTLRLMLDFEIIEPTSVHDSEPEATKAAADRSDNLKFSEGGTAMNRQMNMAFMQEGGMKDDGMSKDPVSGNDIPAGSLAKEVRDDIPAQLSEGEYVVPADVAQYYGIKFFEDLRMEAKMGLAQMDKDGRIGGQPMSVTMIALGQEEEKKKAARGGSIGYNNGGITNASLQAQQAAANPMAGFGYTGQSLSKPPTQTNVPVTTMETWYHPDGRTQVVQRINGEIKPPEMMQYTQAPWSKDAAISNKPRKDNDREPVKLVPKVIGGKTVMMTEGNYTALETSANRLDMPLDKYYNLPFSERVGLVGKEFVEMGVASTEAAKVIKGAKEGLNFDSLIELGKLAFKLTPPGLALSFLQSLSKTPKESGSDNTGGGTGGDTGGDTGGGTNDDDGGISPSTPSNETLDSFTGGSSTDSSPKKVSSGISTIASGAKKVIEDEAAANLREQNMNQGGLLTKPKRKPKKPRGKGLASK